MKVNLDQALPIAGCRIATTNTGIRYRDRDDLLLMAFSRHSVASGLFTRNAFCAAPVAVAKQHLQSAQPRFLLVNAGNANAGTGQQGIDNAQSGCEAVAERFGVRPEEVLPFSTGVIGQQLAIEKIIASLPAMGDSLEEDGWNAAARAIMTTDTQPKVASVELQLRGETVRVSGIAKGSGMVHPDMATMLAFVVTDAVLDATYVRQINASCTERSFHRISVDGDTSTNDACILVATGASNVTLDTEDRTLFEEALQAIYLALAQKIVRDGEGATKFVTLCVNGGRNAAECLQVARVIARSPLVKTALYAADPNWGRILAAVGNAGIEQLDTQKIDMYLDEVCIVRRGGLNPDYREDQGQAVFDQPEFVIRVDLGRGEASDQLWTCDLSHQYVTINAEYRS